MGEYEEVFVKSVDDFKIYYNEAEDFFVLRERNGQMLGEYDSVEECEEYIKKHYESE